jgi:DNA-binding NtrC family response regulator
MITETIGYPTYSIKKVNNLSLDDSSTTSTDDFTETKREKDLFFTQRSNNKRIILVDDDQDILFTYESFLKEDGYEIISFTNPCKALNFIKDLPNFDDLLVTLDIKMKDLNGFQLQQQIKSIDPTIKILFISVLDIPDEILTIIPCLSKEQILIKPVDRKVLISTVKKLLN